MKAWAQRPGAGTIKTQRMTGLDVRDPDTEQMSQSTQRTLLVASRVPARARNVPTMGLVGVTRSPAVVPARSQRRMTAWLPSYWPRRSMRSGSRRSCRIRHCTSRSGRTRYFRRNISWKSRPCISSGPGRRQPQSMSWLLLTGPKSTLKSATTRSRISHYFSELPL